jgi:hypothetical protein
MWWLIGYLFLSLGEPQHHHHQKMLMVLSALNVGFILIFYGWMAIVMYNRDYFAMPALAGSILDIQRWVYWTVSLIALFVLKHKHSRGQLLHVSHQCLTSQKLLFLILLKFVLLGFYLADVWVPNFIPFLREFLGNLTLIVWFSMCVRVASQRFLPANHGELPMHGGHHGHGGMYTHQPYA